MIAATNAKAVFSCTGEAVSSGSGQANSGEEAHQQEQQAATQREVPHEASAIIQYIHIGGNMPSRRDQSDDC